MTESEAINQMQNKLQSKWPNISQQIGGIKKF